MQFWYLLNALYTKLLFSCSVWSPAVCQRAQHAVDPWKVLNFNCTIPRVTQALIVFAAKINVSMQTRTNTLTWTSCILNRPCEDFQLKSISAKSQSSNITSSTFYKKKRFWIEQVMWWEAVVDPKGRRWEWKELNNFQNKLKTWQLPKLKARQNYKQKRCPDQKGLKLLKEPLWWKCCRI